MLELIVNKKPSIQHRYYFYAGIFERGIGCRRSSFRQYAGALRSPPECNFNQRKVSSGDAKHFVKCSAG